VKDGAKLHIIKTEELLYVQAYGDYVLLHTENARHIKEETMKFYEAHLPRNFVRIHRSSIVNSDKIVRIELAAKESYNVHLKNGTCLKASVAGYRLLRERLML
jgi:DNA-binding LytR/AlgR family response regulator